MTRRGLGMAAIIAVLLVGSTVASVLVAPVSGSAGMSVVGTASPPPWESPYHFRREVTVINPASTPLTNYPLLLNLNFSGGRVLSASDEIRLFDSSGIEVPSYVVGQQSSGGFVNSATLLTFITISPDSNTTIWLYYGYPTASLPAYREGLGLSYLSEGTISAELGAAEYQSYVDFAYAATYSETIEPVVSYGAPIMSYGSPALGGGLLSSSDWQTPGNATQFGASVASASFSAGSLTFDQVEIATAEGLISLATVSNLGQRAVSNASLSLVFNESQLASLAPLALTYAENTTLSAASVNGTYIGFAVSPTPSSYDIGPSSELVADALAGGQAGGGSARSSASGVIVSWSFGFLPPGGSASVKAVLGSTPDLTSLESSIFVPPEVQVGQEQTYSGFYFPTVTGIWTANTSLADETILQGGTALLPIQVSGGTILPGSLNVSGTVSYSLPSSSSFATGNQGGWIARATPSGNGSVAYASPSFYSVSNDSYEGRISVYNSNNNGGGPSTASLASPVEAAPRTESAELSIEYMASSSFSEGDPAEQGFYAALNVYNALTGVMEKSLYFPVTGSSTSVAYTGACGQTILVRSSAHLVQGGYLIGDGTWRHLDANVTGLLSGGGSEFKLVFCASSSAGFVGQMNLEVRSATVSFTLPASEALGAYAGSQGGIQLLLFQGIASGPTGATANVSLSFDIASTLQMNHTSGPSFSTYLPEPNVTLGSRASLTPHIQGLYAVTPFFGQQPEVLLNGTSLAWSSAGDGILYVPASSFTSGGFSRASESSTLQLVYQGASLDLGVKDTEGEPISGATVTLAGQGSGESTSKMTASDGEVEFDLVPWNYTLSVVWLGSIVDSSNINLSANQTSPITCSVDDVTVKANDVLGSPLNGAEITIGGYGSNETVQMPHGAATLQIPSNTPYVDTILFDGGQVYHGSLTVTNEGSTITIGTSYLPQWVQLAAAAAAAAALALVAILLYKPWQRRRGSRQTKGS